MPTTTKTTKRKVRVRPCWAWFPVNRDGEIAYGVGMKTEAHCANECLFMKISGDGDWSPRRLRISEP